MSTRRVSWRRNDEVRADEHCTIAVRDAGLSLIGTILGAEGGLPVRIEYRVLADGAGGATSAVHIRDIRGFAQRQLALARDAKGNWTVNGAPNRTLKGCIDVDLGCSPSTNTLPIRRLRLAVGGSTTIKAAWVRFPELTVEKSAQTYARLDEFTYRYSSDTYEAELVVDDEGVVAQYGPWERTGLAAGMDDTEPLDSR
ncbi:MAG TPA: putative glycolipid-binding domain-containing protein [Candidatus Limnocylindrales bacterium]